MYLIKLWSLYVTLRKKVTMTRRIPVTCVVDFSSLSGSGVEGIRHVPSPTTVSVSSIG